MSYTKCSELNEGDVVKHLSRNIFGKVLPMLDRPYIQIVWVFPVADNGIDVRHGWDIKKEVTDYSYAATTLLRVSTGIQIQDLEKHYNNNTIAEKLGLKCHPCWKFETLIEHWLCRLSLGLSNTLDNSSCEPEEPKPEGKHTVDLINQVTGRRLSELQKEMGPAFGALEFAKRATGRSSANALGAIATALSNPNKWIMVIDHHGTRIADSCLMEQVVSTIHKLDYKGFEFLQNQIRFVPILKETKVIHETTHTEVYQPGS